MKRISRQTTSIVLASLFLAAVAAATPSTGDWSGTVASVSGDDLALVGVPDRFRIAGSISESVSGRSLAAGALTPGSAVAIHVGEREADGRFRADRVSVQPKSPLTLQGPITAIADDRLSVEVLGVRVELDSRTAFSGRGASGPARSAADLRAGMTVRTSLAPTASGSLRADDVRVMSSAPPEPGEDQELKGTVVSISSASWTIDDRTFLVDENTVFVGDPGVGDFVEVQFHLDSAGAAVAERIRVEDAENGEREFRGIVEAIGKTSWTISGTVLAVDSSTQILGEPHVGDSVEVEARELGDGSLLATRIQREDAGDEGETEFQGRVDAIGDTAWKIAGREVLVNAATEIIGAPAVGDSVEVKAVSDANGVLTARRIKLEDAQGNDDPGDDNGNDAPGDDNSGGTAGDDHGGRNHGPNHGGEDDSSGHD